MRQTERFPVKGIVRNGIACLKNVGSKMFRKSAISFICQRAMLNRMVFFMRRPAYGSLLPPQHAGPAESCGERHFLLDCTGTPEGNRQPLGKEPAGEEEVNGSSAVIR